MMAEYSKIEWKSLEQSNNDGRMLEKVPGRSVRVASMKEEKCFKIG